MPKKKKRKSTDNVTKVPQDEESDRSVRKRRGGVQQKECRTESSHDGGHGNEESQLLFQHIPSNERNENGEGNNAFEANENHGEEFGVIPPALEEAVVDRVYRANEMSSIEDRIRVQQALQDVIKRAPEMIDDIEELEIETAVELAKGAAAQDEMSKLRDGMKCSLEEHEKSKEKEKKLEDCTGAELHQRVFKLSRILRALCDAFDEKAIEASLDSASDLRRDDFLEFLKMEKCCLKSYPASCHYFENISGELCRLLNSNSPKVAKIHQSEISKIVEFSSEKLDHLRQHVFLFPTGPPGGLPEIFQNSLEEKTIEEIEILD